MYMDRVQKFDHGLHVSLQQMSHFLLNVKNSGSFVFIQMNEFTISTQSAVRLLQPKNVSEIITKVSFNKCRHEALTPGHILPYI